MKADITWDLAMSEDMPFAEGCYRSKAWKWQVVTAWKERDPDPVGVREVQWASGVTGMKPVMPDESKINAPVLLKMMSAILGVDE